MSALGIKIRPKASRPRSHLKPRAVKVASRYHKTSAIPSYNHTYHTCRPISHLLIAQYIYISDSGAASYAFLVKKADEGWVAMHRRSASIIAYRQRRTRHPSRHRMLTRRISERRNFRRECITTNPSYADNYRELHTHTHTPAESAFFERLLNYGSLLRRDCAPTSLTTMSSGHGTLLYYVRCKTRTSTRLRVKTPR